MKLGHHCLTGHSLTDHSLTGHCLSGGGQLQIVLADYEEPPLPIHVLYPEGRRAPAKVRAFLDLAVSRLRANRVLK
jgi:DNA-binding transcriptional LysR family regulator